MRSRKTLYCMHRLVRQHRLQRMYMIADLRGRMGVLPVKRFDNTLANSAAVFIVGLGQHDHQLRHAAQADHIALTQISQNQRLQVFHGNIQTAPGKLFSKLAVHGKQCNMDHFPAANHRSGLHLIQQQEKVVFTEHSALGLGLFPKLLFYGTDGHALGIYLLGSFPVKLTALIRRHHT